MRDRSFDEIRTRELIPGVAPLTDADDRILVVGDCDEAKELIAHWPSLAESDRMRLAPHLEECALCRARVLEAERDMPLGSG